MNWTKEQELAINQEGTNIIVSAGAGSGKTAVLSERVLRKVKSGIDIRNILILTFTNEAAGEMKNRIRKKLMKEDLKEQLEYIDAAYITTFDAYALSIVKKYHYLLNISKNISIIDASLIMLEKERVLEEIFLELYDKKDEDFLKLIRDFTNRNDKVIKEAILSINDALDLKYDKKEYLDSYLENFYKDDYINCLFDEYYAYLKNLVTSLENDVYALEGMVDEKLFGKIYDSYSVLFNSKCYNDLYKIKDIPRVQFRNIPEEAISIKESLKANKDEILELTKYSEEELKEQIKSTKTYVKVIIDIILKLDERLNKYKLKNEAFEFCDIAKMAIRVVKEHEDICEELKNTYNEILIDEYQDTNDLQEIFISNIENSNVYMVGDIKQSIYRFRNANPNIFKNKYDNYAKSIGGEKIDLLKNFRSRKEVLDNINKIFELIMTNDIGGVDYQDSHAMVYGNLAYINEGKNDYDNNMEIIKYDNDFKDFSKAEIEAFIIANDVKKKYLNKYQVYDFDLKKNRNIKYSDFCIILDRGSDMPIYKKIFESLNIPMVVYKDSDLVMENDILIIKNIVNLVILIKEKDYGINMRYAFTSVARSFVGNMSDAEIFKCIKSNSFFETEVYRKCFLLADDLDNKTPNILLREIIDIFNFYENFIKVGNVKAGITRLEYLLDLASSIENLGFTILNFRDYLDNIVSNKKEIRYKELNEDSNCVKIMNIHKSKGLEFAICYFAGFKKDFNLRDLNSRFMFDNKYGILTPFYNEGIGTLLTKTLIKQKYYQDEISEKIRLFYVALTRAKEKIIMVMPDFKNEMVQNNHIDYLTGIKYRSFYNFINSISINLRNYTTTISLDSLNINKDYESVLNTSNLDVTCNDSICFYENEIDSKLIENKHASKIINSVLTREEAKTLEFGTMMHEMLEMTDFKKILITNKYVENLKNNFDFDGAIIYQELEFIYFGEDIEYHGIIDLMLEYDKEIKIIDYKLKNIDDEAYKKQLVVYFNYVKSVSDKDVKLYLYSILDNVVKEIEYVEM